MLRQRTLKALISASGVGLHTGRKVRMTLRPAAIDTGIVFRRVDLPSPVDIPARADAVGETRLSSCLVRGEAKVYTVEHLMSALGGLGVDNAYVDLDGPEVPIMDGSAAPFVAAIQQAGIVALAESRRYIQVLKPVRVVKGDSYGELRPYLRGLRIETEIEFDHPLIGRQAFVVDVESDSFRRDLARARTFGFMRDVAKLWGAGYARGASIDNTVVIADDRVLNPEGLRYTDEFVRHKAVDAIGDLALSGAPLIGAYRSVRGGHKLNHAVLTALFADRSAWTYVEMPEIRRPRGYADLATGFAVPAYGPEVS
jgi:UDP-3-O-[3-hydroxymyristoyl] N-acetylglucosamine deacetylase